VPFTPPDADGAGPALEADAALTKSSRAVDRDFTRTVAMLHAPVIDRSSNSNDGEIDMQQRPASIAAAVTLGTCLMFTAAVADASASGWKQCVKTPLVRFDGTIVDAAIATPALSTLVDLVVRAGLGGALSAPGNLTVFAPTNAAFEAVPDPVLTAIGSDDAVLAAVLTYHVAAGRADPRVSLIPREVATLQGQTVFLDYDGVPQVNQSNAACQGVRTTNGTVWIVDSVLLPQFRQQL
jgi:uncharacterized surface protein with fasciclin (FAS1) repeats